MPEDDSALKKLSNAPRLTTIKYTCRENDGPLNSIQLLFDKGWKTPVYQTEDAQENKCKQGTINIDPNKVIGWVRMLVGDGTLNALEIISIEGDIIAECVFNTGLYGNWEVREVPDGQSIVGLAVSFTEIEVFNRLGFVLASVDE